MHDSKDDIIFITLSHKAHLAHFKSHPHFTDFTDYTELSQEWMNVKVTGLTLTGGTLGRLPVGWEVLGTGPSSQERLKLELCCVGDRQMRRPTGSKIGWRGRENGDVDGDGDHNDTEYIHKSLGRRGKAAYLTTHLSTPPLSLSDHDNLVLKTCQNKQHKLWQLHLFLLLSTRNDLIYKFF